MPAKYKSKREKISDYLENLDVPKPIVFEQFLSEVAYAIKVSEEDVRKVLKTFLNLNKFKLKDGEILKCEVKEE